MKSRCLQGSIWSVARTVDFYGFIESFRYLLNIHGTMRFVHVPSLANSQVWRANYHASQVLIRLIRVKHNRKVRINYSNHDLSRQFIK